MILGKSTREVARTMSLRAIYLTLATHARVSAAQLGAQARAAALGSAAKWDKKHAAQFAEFLRALDAIANPFAPPKQISGSELRALFSALGVPQEKNA